MKGSKFKLILIVLVLIATGFGAVYYYAATKISPEEIRKRALVEIQKVFPNAEVTLGKIDFKLGTSINFEVEKLNIKHSTGDLLDLQSFLVKIPVFSVLTGHGSVDFKIQKPKLSYKEFKKKNNWQMAMGENKQKAEKTDSELSLVIPAFLSNIRINFDMGQTNLDYYLQSGEKGTLAITTFLIKNLNLKEPTAFEVRSNYSQDKTKLSFLAIGEVHLNKLLKGEDLFANILINLNDIHGAALKKPIQEVKANIKITQKPKGDLLGQWDLQFGDSGKAKADFSYKNKNLELSKIESDISLANLVKDLGLKGLEDFKLGKTSFKLNGQIKFLSNNKILPDLSFSISPNLGFSINNIKGDYGLEGTFRNKKLILNGKGEVLDGQIKTSLNGDLNLMQLKDGFEGLSPMSLNIWAKGIKFTKQMIRDSLYKKESSVSTITTTKNNGVNKDVVPLLLPKLRLDMFLDQIKIDDRDFSGKLRAITSLNKLVLRDFDFNYSKGRGVLGLVSEIDNKGISNQINFKLTDLDLKGLGVFLPEVFQGLEGKFNGVVKGNVSKKSDKINHDITVNVKAYNGKIKGLNIKERLDSIIDNMSFLKNKNIKLPEKIDGEFKKLLLDGRFKTNNYDLKSFSFDGPDKTIMFTGNGKLFPNSKSQIGKIDVNLTDKTGKITTSLKRYAGVEVLPLRFEGTQLNMSPNYEYTLTRLAKKALQKKTSLAKSKAKEKMKKTIEKKAGDLLKSKDVKKLLKGFFD